MAFSPAPSSPINGGVNSNLYNSYDLEDHRWTSKQNPKECYRLLSYRCVRIGTNYWFRLPETGVWVDIGNINDAKKQAKNLWAYGILPNSEQITDGMIDSFFDGVEEHSVPSGKRMITTKVDVGSCPYFQGRMVIPGGPRFLDYEGRKYVNVSTIKVMKGDESKLHLGELVILMIYRALCNGEELHDDKKVEARMLFDQIKADKYTNQDFQFLMYWLAALIQRPGINLQTNVWLVGAQQGVGKGTLLTLLGNILGSESVGSLDQTEIEGGWNDHLFGKILIEVNEFDCTGKMKAPAWDKWIKKHTCEVKFPFRQRNMTSWQSINIGNYLFTTNEEIPIYLDKSDRRNQIIKTTNNPFWKEWASFVQVHYVMPDPRNISAGFAFVLEHVKVNYDMIKSAFVNSAKADIQNASQEGSPADWIKHDMTINRNVWTPTKVLYTKYKEYMQEDHFGKPIVSQNKFAREMRKIPCVCKEEIGTFDSLRVRKTPEFKIDYYFDAKGANRSEVAKEFYAFTDVAPMPIYDQELPPEDKISEKTARFLHMQSQLSKT